MKLIRGKKGESQLNKLCQDSFEHCDEVWAAVAYVYDEKHLIKPCYDKKIPLKLWARYDHTIPVKIEILEWFLGKSPDAVCKLIPDIFHPKIIWWRPIGVYIGSANLTDRAWFSNFEAGIYLDEDELEENDLKSELEHYFQDIEDSSQLLTEEIVNILKQHREHEFFSSEYKMKNDFSKIRRLELIESISQVDIKKRDTNKKKTDFLKEWDLTLQYIRDIAEIIFQDKNRPAWIDKNTPKGTQADQFLHAYYYNIVREGTRVPYKEFHEINKVKPGEALQEAISWWASLENPPTNEDIMINEWAPFIEKKLLNNKILSLSEDEFINVITKVHAFRNYAKRANHTSLGLDHKLPSMTVEERSRYLAKRLYYQRNDNNEGILSNLHYLLHGGQVDKLPERLFELCNNPQKKIRHVALSTYGEITGWALPNNYPPRNGRTSKALYALGYNVKIHTE